MHCPGLPNTSRETARRALVWTVLVAVVANTSGCQTFGRPQRATTQQATLDAKWAKQSWDEVEADEVPAKVKAALGEDVEDCGCTDPLEELLQSVRSIVEGQTYAKAQGLYADASAPEAQYNEVIELDLATVDRTAVAVVIGTGGGGTIAIEEQALAFAASGRSRLDALYLPRSIANICVSTIAAVCCGIFFRRRFPPFPPATPARCLTAPANSMGEIQPR